MIYLKRTRRDASDSIHDRIYFLRLLLTTRWVKEDRTGGRKGKEGRIGEEGLRERHKNTRTQEFTKKKIFIKKHHPFLGYNHLFL